MDRLMTARTWANLNGCASLTNDAALTMFNAYREWSARKAAHLYARLEPWGA